MDHRRATIIILSGNKQILATYSTVQMYLRIKNAFLALLFGDCKKIFTVKIHVNGNETSIPEKPSVSEHAIRWEYS